MSYGLYHSVPAGNIKALMDAMQKYTIYYTYDEFFGAV